MRPRRRLLPTSVVVAATAGLLLGGGGRGLAQDATQAPPAQGQPAASESHPAAIHFGTCSQPTAQPTNNAGDVKPVAGDNGPIPPEQFAGTLTAPPVLTTTATTIAAKLDDLAAKDAPRVILVHRSAQDYATYIACGEIGGPVQDDRLVVALRPLSDSGYAGIAVLERDGDNTTSTIYLFGQVLAFAGGQAGPTPTPPPSPTPGPSPMPTPTPTPATTVPATATPPG